MRPHSGRAANSIPTWISAAPAAASATGDSSVSTPSEYIRRMQQWRPLVHGKPHRLLGRLTWSASLVGLLGRLPCAPFGRARRALAAPSDDRCRPHVFAEMSLSARFGAGAPRPLPCPIPRRRVTASTVSFSGTLFRTEIGTQNRTENQNFPVRKTVLLCQYGKPYYYLYLGQAECSEPEAPDM